jgi:peptidoglycan/LPS O-acetylase OafA/YrhL
LAAGLVLAHHVLQESDVAGGAFSPAWLTTFGAAGVDIFFVISGFVMYYTSYGRSGFPPTPAYFMLRRILRIYPLYWLCSAGIAVLHFVGLHKTFEMGAADSFLSLALPPSDHSFLFVGWTLVLEVYFYLVFAAALQLRDGTKSLLCAMGIIAALNVASHALPDGAWKGHFGTPLSAEFCCGMAIGWLYSRQKFSVPCWLALPALAALALTPLFVSHPDVPDLPELPRVFAWGIPAAVLVTAALNMHDFSSLTGRLALRLGAASYSLYLTHPFVAPAYAAAIKRSAVFSRIHQEAAVMCVIIIASSIGLACHLS